MDDKASIATRAFLSGIDREIMSFKKLKQVTKTFGMELSSKVKYKFTGKSRKHKPPSIHRKYGGFLSGYHKNQLVNQQLNE